MLFYPSFAVTNILSKCSEWEPEMPFVFNSVVKVFASVFVV